MKAFKAFDIRGKVPEELNQELTKKIGAAFCEFLKPKTIVIGYDTRDSSKSLYKALVKGVISQNVNILSINLCTTPMFYFAINKLKVDGGIMITSSHSPLNTNGLKLCKKNAESIHIGNGLKEIENLCKTKLIKTKIGKIKKIKILKEYENFLKDFIKTSDVKIGIDGLNMSGVIDYKMLKKFYNIRGINLKIGEPKPYFEPNPQIRKNLKNIKAFVKKHKLDLGLFFDGDCDRVLFIDERGEEIASDIIAAFLIDKSKYKKILKDQQSSEIIDDICKKNKTELIKTKIGHSMVDSKLKETKSDYGSERSGHHYFKEFFNKDNAILTVIKLINILQKPISKQVKPYKKYFHSGELNFKIKEKEKLLKTIEEKYAKYKKDKFDGLKIISKEFWMYIRISKTQDLIRINIESKEKSKLNKIKSEIIKIVHNFR